MKIQTGLRKIARILEQHMTDMGLSEREKNEKTARLVVIAQQKESS